MKKTKKETDSISVPKIGYNSIYDHPDWELLPNKPQSAHGGAGEKKWEKYYEGLKGALDKVTLPEAKARIKREMRNARKRIISLKKEVRYVDWRSASKNSARYLAGKQKEGAEKEGIACLGIPPKSS